MAAKKIAANPAIQPEANAPRRFIIDDGSKRIPIMNQWGDEVGEFYLSPTDIGIYERYNAMGEEIEQIVKPLEGVQGIENMAQFAEATEEIKARLFKVLDKLFGYEGAAARLFGSRHPLMPVAGAFYFQRVLELVGNEINASFEAEAEAFSESVKKYTETVKE